MRDYCCNPFNKPGHISKTRACRLVTEAMCNLHPNKIFMGNIICDQCRKELGGESSRSNVREGNEMKVVDSLDVVSDDKYENYIDTNAGMHSLNETLDLIGESPVNKRKLNNINYPRQKLRKIGNALAERILGVENEESISSANPESEIINQLKEKFNTSNIRSEKVQILTVLPKSWSKKKIEQEFGASNFMVRTAKNLVKEKGVLSCPNPRPGRTLSENTCNIVSDFYLNDDISRIMPGMKDFVSIKQHDGKREHIQKRLVLCNLKEAYESFKSKYPTLKIGFSKFAELRPKNCVLAGASGTHSVCVCTIHQNVKLMILGSKLAQLTKDNQYVITCYNDCLAKMICYPPQSQCYLDDCTNCPGTSTLKVLLQQIMEDNFVEEVTYKQWVSVDHSNLETITNNTDTFIDSLCEKLEKLKRHSFIVKQQSQYQNFLKDSLLVGEFLVICDFAENYSFVLQDEVQAFHWNNSQATIHPFVIYFRENNQLNNTSFVVISECLHHDTVAVHIFQEKLMHFLSGKFSSVKKIFYFSDGAAGQYKNKKNFLNLCLHKRDFQVDAEWHFTATSHGKGACDGVGGVVKRNAARASFQRPYCDQIMTPRQMYEWTVDNIPTISFTYSTDMEYLNHSASLQDQFQKARQIVGTQQLHAFLPQSQNKLLAKVYSFAPDGKEVSVTTETTEIPFDQIHGFVTCMYNGFWWLACVLSTDERAESVNLSFLHPHGPSPSYVFPSKPDIFIVPAIDILTKVDPSTTSA